MSRAAQVAGRTKRGFFPKSLMQVLTLMAAAAILPGCASGGLDMLGVGTDKSIKTGTVAADSTGEQSADSEVWSDEMTIRNAVSSANLTELGDEPLSWANADTGSQGAITQIREIERKGLRCRTFQASRRVLKAYPCFPARRACRPTACG